MKFAVNYLSQFIDKLPTDLFILKEQLINLGIEVESISKDQNGNDIFEVALPPNRADLLSIVGIARELSVVNNAKLKFPKVTKEDHSFNNLKHLTKLKVNNSVPAICPKYLCRVISDYKPKINTPEWIVDFLNKAEIKLISPIVDITNYVMLELGQPLHAFDFDRVINQEINVRMAYKHESIVLLNDQKVNLTEQDLVIADQKVPLAIAGIMGGLDSAITINTKNILLECAYFDPISIRMSSKRHNIISDASQRFTRNIDPNLAEVAINRCCELLLDTIGGKIIDEYIFIDHQHLPTTVSIDLFANKIKKLLGIEIPNKQVVNILQGLGAKVSDLTDGWRVVVPTWRADLRIPEDLIEELAKNLGYHKILSSKTLLPLEFKISSTSKLNFDQELQFKNCLAHRGYNEVINYSFIDLELAKKFDPNKDFYELKNPISRNMGVMRSSLWPGLINNLIYNQNRQIERVRLFEVGTVFNLDPANKDLVLEEQKIAGLITDQLLLENWQQNNTSVDFFSLKNDVIALMQLKNCSNFEFIKVDHPALHPQKSAQISINNLAIGFIGALHPELLLQLSINTAVYLFELDLHALIKTDAIKFQHISKFPAIRRDFSVLVDLNIPVAKLEYIIRSTLGNLLKELIFFDVYIGKGLPNNKKSIAFGVVLQSIEHTLIELEVNQLIQKLLINLKLIGVELRSQ